jgi:hypothetical protein
LGFIDGVNRYAYALNSPVNFLDPTGTVGEGSVRTPQAETRPDYAASPVDTGPSLLTRIGTTLLDVAPVVGGLKSAGQVITGTEFGTGERVNRWEEGLGVVLGALGVKFLTKVDDIADIGADVARQVRRGADGGVPKGPSVGDLRRAGRKDAHHVIQDASVRDLPGYNTNAAPGAQLPGPASISGTAHHAATQVQRQAGGGSYAAERRIGYKALRRGGLSPEEARSAIQRSDEYFESIGVGPTTPTRVPGNRR